MISDAKYTHEIKTKIVMEKAADSLHKKIGLKFKDENNKIHHLEQNFERC